MNWGKRFAVLIGLFLVWGCGNDVGNSFTGTSQQLWDVERIEKRICTSEVNSLDFKKYLKQKTGIADAGVPEFEIINGPGFIGEDLTAVPNITAIEPGEYEFSLIAKEGEISDELQVKLIVEDCTSDPP